MQFFLLITGIVLFPQACSLKCNVCDTSKRTCVGSETTCTGEFTRCGTLRTVSYSGRSINWDLMLGSCFRASDCTHGSVSIGLEQELFTTKCCDTDNCNTEQPPAPIFNSTPNGIKCEVCLEKGECNGAQSCVGEQTFCTSVIDLGIKGCASRSVCVDPPSILVSMEEFRCRSSSGPGAGLILRSALLASLISSFFISE